MNSISIIMTCYREEDLLREAVASVRAQTVQPLELLIVNVGSTDAATISVCKELEASGDAKVLWLKSNVGTGQAKNKGFLAAQGDILVPLDGDDILPPHAVERISHIFKENPECDFIASGFVVERSASDGVVVGGKPDYPHLAPTGEAILPWNKLDTRLHSAPQEVSMDIMRRLR